MGAIGLFSYTSFCWALHLVEYRPIYSTSAFLGQGKYLNEAYISPKEHLTMSIGLYLESGSKDSS
jgi:hypothetical protein